MAFAQPSAPGSGDNFTPAEHNGHLLIVYPKTYTDGAKTKHGESSAADVDIIIVDKFDATGKPVAFINARVFGNLARSVRNDIGGQVLGRLGQGPNTQGSPPWILTAFTDQDAAAATPIDAAYWAGHFKPTPNPMQNAGGGQPAAPGPSPATAQQYAPPAQQWQGAAPAAPQGYGATPSPAPQQYAPSATAPAPATPAAGQPAWSPQPPPQQWSPPPAAQAGPPAQTAAPAAASPAPTAAVDPGLVQFLAQRGVNLPPGTSQADAEAIKASFPA